MKICLLNTFCVVLVLLKFIVCTNREPTSAFPDLVEFYGRTMTRDDYAQYYNTKHMSRAQMEAISEQEKAYYKAIDKELLEEHKRIQKLKAKNIPKEKSLSFNIKMKEWYKIEALILKILKSLFEDD